MSDGAETSYISPSVQRAARLLRHVADGESVSNLSGTAATLGINRTTLLRLLHTLVSERFLERLPGTEGYRIGLGLIGLATESGRAHDLIQAAVPVVTKLALDTGLSAHLGVLDQVEAVYLLRRVPNVPLASNIAVGQRIPAHATTLGRIILAFKSRSEIDLLYADKPLARFAGRTPTTLADLHLLLAEERTSGLSWSDSYYTPGVSSLAAPIFSEGGEVIAAVNVTGPSAFFKPARDRRRKIGRQVKDAADDISRRLGFTGHSLQIGAGVA